MTVDFISVVNFIFAVDVLASFLFWLSLGCTVQKIMTHLNSRLRIHFFILKFKVTVCC